MVRTEGAARLCRAAAQEAAGAAKAAGLAARTGLQATPSMDLAGRGAALEVVVAAVRMTTTVVAWVLCGEETRTHVGDKLGLATEDMKTSGDAGRDWKIGIWLCSYC